MTKTSEFGKGLTYNLGLFLAHEWRYYSEKEVYKEVGIGVDRVAPLWFYGSADHMFEFQAEKAPEKIRKRCLDFKNKVLSLRLPMHGEHEATEVDFLMAIDEAKELLRLFDEEMGIKTIKGEWQ